MKLNNNASMRAGWSASIGGVFRDAEGSVHWCFSERCCTSNVGVAEAMTIRRGLQYARDMEVRDLEVESDAQVVIYTLLHPKQDLSYLGCVLRDILELVEVFDRVTFVWTRRSGNCVAHRLTFLAFSFDDVFFSVHVPKNVVATVEADHLAL